MSGRASLFRGAFAQRKLKVMVDADIADLYVGQGRSSRRGDLEYLMSQPEVEAWSYAADGPPEGYERSTLLCYDNLVKGWITYSAPKQNEGFWGGECRAYDGDSCRAMDGFPLVLTPASFPSRGNEVSEGDRLAFSIAKSLQPDIYVTNREALLGNAKRLEPLLRARICDADDARALVLFYLRTCDKFFVYCDGRASECNNENGFFRLAAYLRLPVLSRSEQSSLQDRGDEKGAVFQRNLRGLMEDASELLVARDHLAALSNQPQSWRVSYEALFLFNGMLVLMSGLLDCAALQADLVFGMNSDKRNVGWNKSKWTKGLKEASGPQKAWPLLESEGKDYLELLSCLRNSIHSEPMGATQVVERRRHARILAPANETLISLTGGKDKRGIERVCGKIHQICPTRSEDLWGTKRVSGEEDTLLADPQIFMERLLFGILEAVEKTLNLIAHEANGSNSTMRKNVKEYMLLQQLFPRSG